MHFSRTRSSDLRTDRGETELGYRKEERLLNEKNHVLKNEKACNEHQERTVIVT